MRLAIPSFLVAAALAVSLLAAPAQAASERRLVFFMNPNGAPCQMQDRVLQEMAGELKGKVQVVYYRTTVEADILKFQQYGVRSLPLLLVTDAGGKEIRRGTPGIQSAAQVRQLVAR